MRGLALGAARLVLASAVILAVAYFLSWQILYSGPVGGDTLFHLHLVQWVDSSFPSVDWWYRFDDHGIPYREGYPLAAHWFTAALHRLSGLSLTQAMQAVEFAITPLDAIGVYVFCAWRLGRPLAGLIAGVAFLLSPLSWTFLVDWGFYANQAGSVLFMPAVIALDVFFEEWSAGRRTWRFRASALATMALVAALGFVAPFLLGAAVATVVLYALAVTSGGLRRAAAWVFVAAPLLCGGAFLLTVFWSLPQQAYLSFAASHAPPRGFDPGLFPVWSLAQILSLHPLQIGQIADHASISPAVGLAAAAGVLATWRNGKARALAALVVFGLLTMTTTALEQAAWNVPVLGYLVHARAGVTLVQFFVPVLAGLGLTEVPLLVAAAAARALRLRGRPVEVGAAALLVAVLVAEAAVVVQFAQWTAPGQGRLAYGDFQPRAGDVWQLLTAEAAPLGLDSQLAPGAWRAPVIGCALRLCPNLQLIQRSSGIFPSAPQRAVVDANVPGLLMDFNALTGGGQAYSYNFQLPASQELDGFVLDTMLNQPGVTAKEELANLAGIDAVALGPSQAARAADYAAMGWVQSSFEPLAFVNPRPAGLGAEWPAGTAALVVGGDQRTSSHPYNDIFERAAGGLIPSAEAWLVRGRSPYIDDYSAAELARFPALVMVGYRYHDQGRAWSLLDGYVRSGGSLYIETGWQYVDPDWNLGAPAPALLPVDALRWGALNPHAPVLVDGAAQPAWGAMTYGAGGWGASSAAAAGVRPGATAMVSVGGRVVVAEQRFGNGRVVWSGMNLLAHDAGVGSQVEDAFVASVFAGLLAVGGAQADAPVTWTTGDSVRLDLAPSAGATWVMLKESFAPGWSAVLRWPGSASTAAGARAVPLYDGELDFLVARLDSVPAGATLTLTYSPGGLDRGAAAASALGLALMLLWVARPRWFALAWGRVWAGARSLASLLPAGDQEG